KSRWREIWVQGITDPQEQKEILAARMKKTGNIVVFPAKEGGISVISRPTLADDSGEKEKGLKAEKYPEQLHIPKNAKIIIDQPLRAESIGKEDKVPAEDDVSWQERIKQYALQHGVNPREINGLLDQARHLRNYLEDLLVVMGADGKTQLLEGEEWAYFSNTNTVTYPVLDLIRHSAEYVAANALHEGSHRDIDRFNPDEADHRFFFKNEVLHLLFNTIADTRVDWNVEDKFPGQGKLDAFYKAEFPKDMGEIGASEKGRGLLAELGALPEQDKKRAGQLLPHEQFAYGLMYLWRHQESAPFVQHQDARAFLEKHRSALDELAHLLPQKKPVQLPTGEILMVPAGEMEKMRTMNIFLKRIRQEILPDYEKLVQQSQKEVEKMLAEQERNKQGSGESKPGRSISEELLSEKAKKILEDRARKGNEKLRPHMKPPQYDETMAASTGEKKKGETAAEGKASAWKPAKTYGDLIRENIRLKETAESKQGMFEKYFHPLARLADDLRGRLENILFPNSRFRRQGWFYSGRPNIRRLMRSIFRGFANPGDLRFFEKPLLPIKRRYAVSLIIDQSGSMWGKKSKVASQTNAMMMKIFNDLEIPLACYGFADGLDKYQDFSDQFSDEDRNRIMRQIEIAYGAGGGTNDRAAVALASNDLHQQDADRKIMFVITDGEGNYGDVKPVLAEAKKRGIEVIAIGLGPESKTVLQSYTHSIYVPRVQELPEKISHYLENEFALTYEVAGKGMQVSGEETADESAERAGTASIFGEKYAHTAPLWEEPMFRGLTFGLPALMKGLSVKALFSLGWQSVSAMLGWSIVVFAGAHIIVRWIKRAKEAIGWKALLPWKFLQKKYRQRQDLKDFFKYLIPAILFTGMYIGALALGAWISPDASQWVLQGIALLSSFLGHEAWNYAVKKGWLPGMLVAAVSTPEEEEQKAKEYFHDLGVEAEKLNSDFGFIIQKRGYKGLKELYALLFNEHFQALALSSAEETPSSEKKDSQELKTVLQHAATLTHDNLLEIKQVFTEAELIAYWPELVSMGQADIRTVHGPALAAVKHLIVDQASLRRIGKIFQDLNATGNQAYMVLSTGLPLFKAWIHDEAGLQRMGGDMAELARTDYENVLNLFQRGLPRLKQIFSHQDLQRYWPVLMELGKADKDNAWCLYAQALPVLRYLIFDEDTLRQVGRDLVGMGKSGKNASPLVFDKMFQRLIEAQEHRYVAANWTRLKPRIEAVLKTANDYNRTRLIELFNDQYLELIPALNMDLFCTLDFYQQVMAQEPRLNLQALEGIAGALRQGIVSPGLEQAEQAGILEFIRLTRSFSPALYHLYKQNGEAALEPVKTFVRQVLADEVGEQEIAALEGYFKSQGIPDAAEAVVASMQMAIPSSGASFVKKGAIQSLLQKYREAGDLRGHVPAPLQNRMMGGRQPMALMEYRLQSGQEHDADGKIGGIIHALRYVDRGMKAAEQRQAADNDRQRFKASVRAWLRNFADAGKRQAALEDFYGWARHFEQLGEKIDAIRADYQGLKLLEGLFMDKDNLSVLAREVLKELKAEELPRSENEKPIDNARLLARHLTAAWTKVHASRRGQAVAKMLNQYSRAEIQDTLLPEISDQELAGFITALEPAGLRMTHGDIVESLLAGPLQSIQNELGKYEMEKTGQVELAFRVVKGIPYGLWGMNAGVCIAPDVDLWKKPEFTLLAMMDMAGEKAVGFVHLFEQKVDGKKVLFVPGIEPSVEFLSQVKAEDVYPAIEKALLAVAEAGGYEKVYLPTDKNIASNRSDIARIIEKKYAATKRGLKEAVQWNNLPRPYPFQEVYVLWEKDKGQAAGVPASILGEEQVYTAPLWEEPMFRGLAFGAPALMGNLSLKA
ncbi:VWA domain-containing protein, partial [candidate division FCPU426 bacterium]|nr:VWA domain-containing protein [candidate division FCPU426 bacterium]